MILEFERATQATNEARALLAALDAELQGSYSCDVNHALTVEQVFEPKVHFFLVRTENAAIACGAVTGDSDCVAELKRMYVMPEMRGRGVVQALIAHLEATATALGFTHLALETGDTLIAAMKAYERAGFKRCAAFGSYARLPAHRLTRSVFFEKFLPFAGARPIPGSGHIPA